MGRRQHSDYNTQHKRDTESDRKTTCAADRQERPVAAALVWVLPRQRWALSEDRYTNRPCTSQPQSDTECDRDYKDDKAKDTGIDILRHIRAAIGGAAISSRFAP